MNNKDLQQWLHPETIADSLTKLRPEGLLTLVRIHKENQEARQRNKERGEKDERAFTQAKTFRMPEGAGQAADWIAYWNADQWNIYWTVNVPNRALEKKPQGSDIAEAAYYHADVDPDVAAGATRDEYIQARERLMEEVLPRLLASDPTPTLVIDSGNGLGLFWRTTDRDVDRAESINRRLIEKYGADAGTWNRDRLMRVPQTWNWPSATKIAKGYTPEPTQAKLLKEDGDSCSFSAMDAALPPLPQAQRTYRAVDATMLEPVDEAAVSAKLEDALEKSLRLRARWNGDAQGLNDTSRSGFDFSVMALLKASGFTYSEAAHLIVNAFKYGTGTDIDERYLERLWSRSGVLSADELVSLCVEANQQGEDWTQLLRQSMPNRQTIDQVLTALGERHDFATKRELKRDYDEMSRQQRISEAQEHVAADVGDRALISWDATALNQMVSETERALTERAGRWEVLRYSGMHAFVKAKPPTCMHAADGGGEATDIPVFERYNQRSLRLRIEQSAAFCAENDGIPQLIPVPTELPGLLLDYPDSQLPVTTGLATHPLISPRGDILIEEGLDLPTGLYVAFGGTQFLMPDNLTAQQGVAVLRNEMLAEFPFASELDQAAALALVLTAVQRKTLPIAPGFLINASTQGTGKTTLARMVHLLLTGRDLPVTDLSDDGAEQQKALVAMLMESVPMICYDNVPDAFNLKSSVLARVLTSESYQGRILGASEMAELPTNTTFVVTGNNITADADLATRMLEVRLQSDGERPDQRIFRNPDVVAYAREKRVRWMQAALAVLRCRDKPQPEVKPSRFPAWDRAVRWPLLNAGLLDPIAKFDEMVEQSPDTDARNAWMLGLVHAFGVGTPFRSSDLLNFDQPYIAEQKKKEAYETFLITAPPVKGWRNVRSIGHQINKLKDRTVLGYTLKARMRSGYSTFEIRRVSDIAVDPSDFVKPVQPPIALHRPYGNPERCNVVSFDEARAATGVAGPAETLTY